MAAVHVCAHCKGEFRPTNRPHQTYCSRACYRAANGFEEKRCAVCGERVRLTGRKRKYCSIACRSKANSGAGNHKYKGGWIGDQGYRHVYVDGRKQLEHRYIMAQHLGRPLLRGEVIHHRDGDRLNNAIENLELVASNRDHILMHYTGYRTETEKQCVKCLRVKPRSEFYRRNRTGRDPHRSRCKTCSERDKASYRLEHAAEISAYNRRYQRGRRESLAAA